MTYSAIIEWFAGRDNYPKSPRTCMAMIGVTEVELDHMTELGLLHRSGSSEYCKSYSLKNWRSYQSKKNILRLS